MSTDTTDSPEQASLQQSMQQTQEQVTGLVLAGGMGRRMQGIDKGLVPLAGREMVAYVIDALRVNVAEVIVNANRNEPDYAGFGVRVIADSIEGYQGPLAGVEAGMAAAATPWLFTCPCDSPMHSTELLPYMWQQVQTRRNTNPDVVIGMASDGDRTQPVFSLLHTSLLPSLRSYLGSGERKIDRWFAQHAMITVDCSRYADSFVNVNTEQQKQELESRLGSDSAPNGLTSSGRKSSE
jgi:molybdopterin-guanine dinucleotide biosynthesis protein A